MASPLGLESLFESAFVQNVPQESFESVGPVYSPEDLQMAMDVAEDSTALECTLESLNILQKHKISFEGFDVGNFFKGIWEGIKKFFKWIANLIKGVIAFIVGLVGLAGVTIAALVSYPFVKNKEKSIRTTQEFIDLEKDLNAALAESKQEREEIEKVLIKSRETVRENISRRHEELRTKVKEASEQTGADNTSSSQYREASETLDHLLKAAKEGRAKREKKITAATGHVVATDEGVEIVISPESLKDADRKVKLIEAALKEVSNYNDKNQKILSDILTEIDGVLKKGEISDDAARSLAHLAGKITSAVQKITKDNTTEVTNLTSLPCFKLIAKAREVQKSLDAGGGSKTVNGTVEDNRSNSDKLDDLMK